MGGFDPSLKVVLAEELLKVGVMVLDPRITGDCGGITEGGGAGRTLFSGWRPSALFQA